MAMQDLRPAKKPGKAILSDPWGLRITLDEAALKKLGIVNLPPPGAKLMFEAKADVAAARKDSDGKSVTLQITHMDLEMDEDEVVEGELTRGEAGAMLKLAKKISRM